MPDAADTTERQKCLFGAARTGMSNDRDWRQIGGYLRIAADQRQLQSVIRFRVRRRETPTRGVR